MFDIDIGDMMFSEEQQHIMDNIVRYRQRLHFPTCTPGSGKTFFVKYIAQYFYIHNKIVILSTTTKAIPLRLSRLASTIHIVFCIPTHGYLFGVPKPSSILTKLKNGNIISIDEMSIMTSNMLCLMEQRLKGTPAIRTHHYSKTSFYYWLRTLSNYM